ncbi:MAG: permease [Candidatus Micrarchaeota archaeon]
MDYYALISAGFGALYGYLLLHTLFCLVPAFFIAGAMSALIPKNALTPYLGKNSPKHVAYPIAIATGLLLAVCSCTVLPLFAGIRKRGAGLGPAIAFLYTAPATNILAILYTSSLIGWDFAIARIGFSVAFAIIIGITLSKLFPEESGKEDSNVFKKTKEKTDWKRLLYLFGLLVAILLVGTRISEEMPKYALTAVLAMLAYAISKKYFSKEEIGSWMEETWGFTVKIAPLLFVGVFAAGIIGSLIPSDFIIKYVGDNSLLALTLPVLFGVFMYFPTLVEVPMAKTFLALGMAKGPLLAYLLADPVISLPSILVVSGIIGTKRTALYVGMIIALSVIGGYLFGLR